MMIRRLRIKFVCIVMTIAMLMVGGILGVAIYFTANNMQMQSIAMMRTIGSSPVQLGDPRKPTEDGVRLPFFVAQISEAGKLISVDGSYYDLSDEDYVQQIVDAALASGAEFGVLEGHDLRFLLSFSPRGRVIVFSDTVTETSMLRGMAYSSLLIFLMAMLVFFGISVLLSRWVTRPVEKAWNQQRQFVADASHELKTPLAIIMTGAELLQNGENAQEHAANVLNTTYQMRSLVENLLDMARIDNGAVRHGKRLIDFSQLVSDAALSFRLLYEKQEMALSCIVAEELYINGSEQHLYQVMDVLLDNGLKYAAPCSTVEVRMTKTGRYCLLTVFSAGTPLTKADLKNIFKRFYRADQARALNGSYGLGLAIAESVVEAHRGRIWAESKENGNTFFVQLPLAHRHSSA